MKHTHHQPSTINPPKRRISITWQPHDKYMKAMLLPGGNDDTVTAFSEPATAIICDGNIVTKGGAGLDGVI